MNVHFRNIHNTIHVPKINEYTLITCMYIIQILKSFQQSPAIFKIRKWISKRSPSNLTLICINNGVFRLNHYLSEGSLKSILQDGRQALNHLDIGPTS